MGFGHGKIQRRVIAAAALLIAGVGLIGWGLFSFLAPNRGVSPASPIQSANVPTGAFARPHKWPCPIPGNFKEVVVPVALLCDYYEHLLEHVPPRDPSGVMQRREHHYAAPPDPFELAKSRLGASTSDRDLAGMLDKARIAWLAGAAITKEQLEPTDEQAAKSSLTSDALIEIGRGFAWLYGDQAAAFFYRAGLDKARVEYASVVPGDPASLPLLRALAQMKALWRLNDYSTMETRFALASRLYPAGSQEARRSKYLHADALARMADYAQAAKIALNVYSEDRNIGDLGALDRSDIPEFQWFLGFVLYGAKRYDDALPHLHAVARPGVHVHSEVAAELEVASLTRLGQSARANAAFDNYVRRYRPSARDALWLVQLLEKNENQNARSEP